MADAPYNVHTQQEDAARAAEEQDYQNLVASFQSRLQALGAGSNVTNNWYQALGGDLTRLAKGNGANDAGSAARAGIQTGLAGMGTGLGAAIKGRKGWRHAQAEEAKRQAQVQSLQEEMARALEAKHADIEAGRGTRQRLDLTEQVKGLFDDPSRLAQQKSEYDAMMQNSLAQIQDAYKGAYTTGVQNVADRGLLGSSIDTQKRADLGATRDAGAAEAANAAGSTLQGRRASDQQTRQQLMQLINSTDPAQAAAAQQRLAELNSRTNDAGLQGSMQQQGWAAGDWANQLRSQALGGIAYAGANGVKQGANRIMAQYGSAGSGG